MNATDPAEFTFKDGAASPEDGFVALIVDPKHTAATGLPWEEPGPSRKCSTKNKQQAKARRKRAKASRRRNR